MSTFYLYLFLIFVTSCFAAADVEEDEGVLVLNEDNFEEVVKETKLLLVEFYAPWCGHCKKLAPQFAKAAQQLLAEAGDVSGARLAKVDCTRHKKLAERHSIRGYPTLKLHTADRWVEYEGDHTAEAIVAWLRRRAGPPAVTLTTAEEAEAFLAQHEAAVVGFFAAGAGSEAFLEWAAQEESLSCAMATTEELTKKYDAADGSVVIFKQYDERRHDLSGPVDVAELSAWVARLSPRLLLRFGDDTADTVFDSAGPGTLLLFIAGEGEESETMTAVTTAVARDHRGEMLFTWVDVTEKSFGRVLEYFGVKPSDAPAVRIVQPSDMSKYRPENLKETPSAESLKEFVTAYLGGELKPYLLSEDLPSDWDARPVRQLVGTNFDQVVLDKSKTVLVDFYAPWCGHCRKLEPELDKLGEKYKDSDSVLVAKMDATLNELTHSRPRSFPTIKMWKKGTNEVVEYNGERTAEGMTRFIESGGEYGKAPPEEGEDYEDEDEDEDFEYSEDYGDDEEYAGHDEL